MLNDLKRSLRPACTMFVALSLLTGLAYPTAVTALAQALFPRQAEGSLVVDKGRVVGSELIGQQFAAPGHFWGRPSATAPMPCNAAASSGSNLGPGNPAQLKNVAERAAALRASLPEGDPGDSAPIPADLLTASGSGLDPHISSAAALFQASRVARARGLDEAAVRALIARRTEGRTLGFLGEPRVNVLLLNRDLDSLGASAENAPTRP